MDTRASHAGDGLTICRARPEQNELLSCLAFRSKAYWPNSLDHLVRCVPALRVTAEDIAQWPFHVGEINGDVVGFVGLKEVAGENRLDHLWIDPRFIGKGYGRRLFHYAVEQARSLGWKSFRLAADPFALEFYLKLGCRQIGRVQSKIKPDFFLPHLELIF